MTLSKTLAKDWPILLILIFPFLLIAFVWDRIPDEIAMHWNARGEVDGWGTKGFDVFFLPLINVGCYLLLLFVPYIDPKKKTENHQKAVRAFRSILPIVLTAIFLFMMLQWLGYEFDIGSVVYLGISCLFLVMGNYMQALKPNYFIGIRTPWTLESEDIWRKTHRMGSKVWVIGSLLLIGLWFLVPTENMPVAFLVGVIVMALLPAFYSFYLFLQEQKTAA